ncbi:MAG: hypothetical protein GC204_19945 [Chloroflexi bacterium]|nr:hypothetical protein [Chloroflexota bacterium]
MLSVYRELINHLADHVSPEDILAFHISDSEQQRAEELTERNKAGQLTSEETRELVEMIEFDELLSFLKAKALHHQRLPQRS